MPPLMRLKEVIVNYAEWYNAPDSTCDECPHGPQWHSDPAEGCARMVDGWCDCERYYREPVARPVDAVRDPNGRLAAFRNDDVMWPDTTLVETDAAAAYALRMGMIVWSARYGEGDESSTDEDGSALFATLDEGDLETLESLNDDEDSGWGPFRVVGSDPTLDRLG